MRNKSLLQTNAFKLLCLRAKNHSKFVGHTVHHTIKETRAVPQARSTRERKWRKTNIYSSYVNESVSLSELPQKLEMNSAHSHTPHCSMHLLHHPYQFSTAQHFWNFSKKLKDISSVSVPNCLPRRC